MDESGMEGCVHVPDCFSLSFFCLMQSVLNVSGQKYFFYFLFSVAKWVT